MKRVPCAPLKASASWKAHAEEAPGDRVPEGRSAGLVDHAAQLGEHPLGEAGAMQLDEQIAAAREQHAQPAGALGRVEEQAADLRAALEIGAEAQHLGAEGLAELRRCLGHRADPVGVEGLPEADPAEHLAGAADRAGIDILQHEDEQVAERVASSLAREGSAERASLAVSAPLSGGRLVKPPPVSLAIS